jgi:hypothetical protein
MTRRLATTGVAIGLAAIVSLIGCASRDMPPAPPNQLTFEQRCADPATVRCVGFDSPAEVDRFVYPPASTNTKRGQVVTDVKASGAGSLRFEVPSNTSADTSGTYWQNFSDDLSVQFGEGQQFFVQWRQRFSREFLSEARGCCWKQAIIGEGDRPGVNRFSCTQLELVVTQGTWGYPTMYHSCGGKDGHSEGLEETWRSVSYRPDQWMTFQVQVKIGRWYRNDQRYHRDSTIRLWVAEEGQPSKLVIDETGYDLANDDPAAARYGKVWLLPYQTGKDPARRHPTGYTWYDELVISRSRIADPA